jgi:lipopolysaccharide transport system permease protein
MTNDAPQPAYTDRDRGAVVIEPHRGWIGVNWSEMLRYRELLYFLVWRDIKVKYKQAYLGFTWAIFVPMLSVIIYSALGGAIGLRKFIDVDAMQLPPYPLYMYCGLIPWLFLQRALNEGGNSLVSQQPLMTKVYLPRLYLPTSSIGGALIDMAIMAGLLVVLATFYYFKVGFVPSWQIVFVIPLFLLTLISALGIAYTFSAAIVLYRDLRFLLPFFAQFGLWLSAVVFPPGVLAEYKDYFALNPVAGIISGYRSAILGLPWEWPMLISSIIVNPILLVFGLFYFKRVERRFADIA